jgi:hypothetical protein
MSSKAPTVRAIVVDAVAAGLHATVLQVLRESETRYVPRFKTKVDTLEQFDVAFVGS